MSWTDCIVKLERVGDKNIFTYKGSSFFVPDHTTITLSDEWISVDKLWSESLELFNEL